MEIDIPFGAKDSELKGWKYTIPEGYTAEIKDGEIIVKSTESEDERIRKELIQFLRDYPTNLPNGKYSRSDFFDWLEKQKDSPMPEDTVIFQKGVAEGRRLEREDMEKEQKPAEWSEQDIQYYDAVMDMITNALYLPCRPRDEVINWFKNLRPQPKIGWSEEDEKQIRQIERIVKNAGCSKMLQEKIHNWLKSLRPPKDCSGCAKHLEGYISGRGDAENKLLDQFGILIMPEGELHMKPRWKPSEEQMEALKNVSFGTYQNGDGPALRELYEQLKKL